MNTARHFETYRASLRRDALEGCTEYAQIVRTKDPGNFPKVFDYLSHALKNAHDAAGVGDHHFYRQWVTRHQEAAVALFERMVEDVLWDYRNVTVDHIYEMIQERGWRWFKFCKKHLEMTLNVGLDGRQQKIPMVWVPRYNEVFKQGWAWKGKVVLDADELGWLFTSGVGPTETHPIIKFKWKTPAQKILKVDGTSVLYKPVLKINEGDEVVDWTLRLF